jgi:methionyl-tRNA synthetase
MCGRKKARGKNCGECVEQIKVQEIRKQFRICGWRMANDQLKHSYKKRNSPNIGEFLFYHSLVIKAFAILDPT